MYFDSPPFLAIWSFGLEPLSFCSITVCPQESLFTAHQITLQMTKYFLGANHIDCTTSKVPSISNKVNSVLKNFDKSQYLSIERVLFFSTKCLY